MIRFLFFLVCTLDAIQSNPIRCVYMCVLASCLSYAHWGSWSLTDRVKQLRPKVHVFGHVHNSHGIVRKGETLYINAAQDENPQPIFFDIWV